GYPYKGNPQAAVVIEEYSDFQCPVCARYTREVAPRLDEKYVKTGQVYYIFRYFPFLGPESFRAAEAAA
ncbi:MAG: disulfide bond formation protein DsbA, partial [Thermoflexus sp.]